MCKNKVSIVVIGKNEALNLDNTFSAIDSIQYPKDNYEVIYVDTGSTDNSVEIAKRYTTKVYLEDRKWNTPGLARNRGLIEAENDIIHFIDGDIKIDKDYIKKAIEKIQQPNIDAVYGFLEERSIKGVNEILLTHWKGRVEGFHSATGGGGTYKKSALLDINGYDERIRKGQETEMGERYLKAGFKIWFMNERMGEHDYGVKSISDLVEIYYLAGINRTHLMLVKGSTDFYNNSKKIAINNIFFCSIFLIIFLGLGFFFGFFIGFLFSVLSYLFYFIFKYIFIKRIKKLNDLRYFLLMYSLRYISFFGQVYFMFRIITNHGYRNSVITEKDVFKKS